MKKLMNILMLSCKKASGLIDKKSVVPLSFMESFQLRIHKSMCSACASYEKQGKVLDELLKKHIPHPGELNISPAENLDDLKKRIISKL